MSNTLWSCVILGDPRTKKNSQRIVGSGPKCPSCGKFKKQWIMQSTQHDAWFKDATRQINRRGKPPEAIKRPMQLVYRVYVKTRRIVDDTNLQAAIDDLLVRNEVIDDDNIWLIKSRDGSRYRYDPYNPRVEITITASDEGEPEQLGLFEE